MNRIPTSFNTRVPQLRRTLARLSAGAATVAFALMLAGLGVFSSASSGYAQIGGATYEGEIAVVDSQCGGGTVAVTLSADAGTIITVLVDGATFGGIPINDLELPDLSIVIEDDGSFATATALLSFGGSIDGDAMSGTITVPAFNCSVTFTAATSATAPVADEPVDDDTDVPADESPAPSTADTDLPTAGTGPLSQSGTGARWLLLAAGLGVLGLAATGVAVMRRRA